MQDANATDGDQDPIRIKSVNPPRPFNLKEPTELVRWFREMEGYMNCSNGMDFINAGTDFKGRKFALEAFHEMRKEAEEKLKEVKS